MLCGLGDYNSKEGKQKKVKMSRQSSIINLNIVSTSAKGEPKENINFVYFFLV